MCYDSFAAVVCAANHSILFTLFIILLLFLDFFFPLHLLLLVLFLTCIYMMVYSVLFPSSYLIIIFRCPIGINIGCLLHASLHDHCMSLDGGQ